LLFIEGIISGTFIPTQQIVTNIGCLHI
jgi:hypothetical protein